LFRGSSGRLHAGHIRKGKKYMMFVDI